MFLLLLWWTMKIVVYVRCRHSVPLLMYFSFLNLQFIFALFLDVIWSFVSSFPRTNTPFARIHTPVHNICSASYTRTVPCPIYITHFSSICWQAGIWRCLLSKRHVFFSIGWWWQHCCSFAWNNVNLKWPFFFFLFLTSTKNKCIAMCRISNILAYFLPEETKRKNANNVCQEEKELACMERGCYFFCVSSLRSSITPFFARGPISADLKRRKTREGSLGAFHPTHLKQPRWTMYPIAAVFLSGKPTCLAEEVALLCQSGNTL